MIFSASTYFKFRFLKNGPRYSFDRHQATRELIRFLDETWTVINTSTIEIAEKANILFWFNDDPRYGMRYRSDESWFGQSKENPAV